MKTVYFILALLVCILVSQAKGQSVFINEIVSSNSNGIRDEDGDAGDWIELYNGGSSAVSLAGFGLTDNPNQRYKWIFPDLSINAGQFLLVWATGKNRLVPGAPLHTNFSISAAGEPIMLSAPGNITLDSVGTVVLPANIAWGRQPDGTGPFFYFYRPTPGASNTTTALPNLLSPPNFSHPGGVYDSSFTLTLSHPNPQVTIVYTLDGSEPDFNNTTAPGKTYRYKNEYPNGQFFTNHFLSKVYQQPISLANRTSDSNKISMISTTPSLSRPTYFPTFNIKKGTVVKAKAYVDSMGSETATNTYFISNNNAFNYPFPIVSISKSDEGLFDYERGIYVAGVDFATQSGGRVCGFGNFNRRGEEAERKVHFEYFTQGRKAFEQTLGMRLQGNCSRANPKKSLRLYARSEYGSDTIHFPFHQDVFPGAIPGNKHKYRRMVLRLPNYSDYSFSRLFHGINETALGRYEPVIQFLNGEYWGISMLRDRFDEHYFSINYGLNPDNISIISIFFGHQVGQSSHYAWGLSHGLESDFQDFLAMRDFIVNNDMSNPANYAQAAQMLHMPSFPDHVIMKMYAKDSHYAPEATYWRTRVPENHYLADGKWRVHTKDFDDAMRGDVSLGNFRNNRPALLTFGNEVYKSLIRNVEFRKLFINRYADLLNTALRQERHVAIINEILTPQTQPVFQEMTNRYNNTLTVYGSPPRPITPFERGNLFSRVLNADRQERDTLRAEFGVGDNCTLIVNVADTAQGYIKVNSINILPSTVGIDGPNVYPWRGIYFRNVPITLTAIPKPGFRFTHWSGDTNSTTAQIELAMTDTLRLVAHFEEQEVVVQPIPLTFWFFGTNIPNDLPLNSVNATFSRTTLWPLQYRSCLTGYPFQPGDSAWRTASMERRNLPTELNYRSEANNNVPFATSSMRGIQIKAPFKKDNRINEMLISLEQGTLRNIKLSLAAQNEGSADSLHVLYRINQGEWTSTGLDSAKQKLESRYRLHSFDFSRVVNSVQSVSFDIKITFAGSNLEQAGTGRVNFNNIAIDGDQVLNLREKAKIGIFPNPSHGRFSLVSAHAIEAWQLFDLRGNSLLIGRGREIAAESLKPGSYLLKVQTSKGQAIQKLMILPN